MDAPVPAPKTALLIVDDEEPIRNLMAHVAERAGFDVEVARDGVEALEMMSRRSFPIVIVDLMMPRLNGFELVEQLGTFRPRPYVIVATALPNVDTSGLDSSTVRLVIRKPFDIHAVANTLVETAQQIAQEKIAVPDVAIERPQPES